MSDRRDEDAVWAVLEGTIGLPATETATAAAPSAVLVHQAAAGHSGSARALANISDAIVALAESAVDEDKSQAPRLTPPDRLRDRILAAARQAVPSKPAADQPPQPEWRAASHARENGPSETLARMHKGGSDEALRARLVEQLGARGVEQLAKVGPVTRDQRATDHALTILIDQLAPFLSFEAVYVSTVVGGETIHRVHRGFPTDLGDVSVVPRELSFCTHTVSGDEPLLVEDASREAFFRQSVLVRTLGARSYLGIPLHVQGVAIGSLCGLSRSPRIITDEDVAFVAAFARVAEALIAKDENLLARWVRSTPAVGDADSVLSPPIIYEAETFQAMVQAQRARVRGLAGEVTRRGQPLAGPTLFVDAPGTLLESKLLELPPSVVTGALPAASGHGLIVPARHPAVDRVEELIRELGPATRIERIPPAG
ncbi:MAG: GAF domain-containing protein [Polyangiaceae bacterium]